MASFGLDLVLNPSGQASRYKLTGPAGWQEYKPYSYNAGQANRIDLSQLHLDEDSKPIPISQAHVVFSDTNRFNTNINFTYGADKLELNLNGLTSFNAQNLYAYGHLTANMGKGNDAIVLKTNDEGGYVSGQTIQTESVLDGGEGHDSLTIQHDLSELDYIGTRQIEGKNYFGFKRTDALGREFVTYMRDIEEITVQSNNGRTKTFSTFSDFAQAIMG